MRLAFAVSLLLALAVPAAAQSNVKGRIGGRLNDAMGEREAELNRAMGNEKQPPSSGEKTEGWIEKPIAGGAKARLYFAHPPLAQNQKANLPGLIVIHEWWGLNEDIQERTREFAGKGYYAVAVDLYDGKATKDPKEAAELKKKLTDADALVRLKTGVALLAEEARSGAVDSSRIGVIGWCMGGAQALNLATSDPRVHACVVFYGTPITDAGRLKNLKGPVLGVFGKEDKSIPNELVDKFEQALKTAGVANEIHRYDGVGHAFASRGNTANYTEAKAAEAWKVTWDWLEKNLATSGKTSGK